MQAVSRILVPVDSSSDARAVCDYALGLAEAFDAKGTVLHVRPPPQLPSRPALVEPLAPPWDCAVEPLALAAQRQESPADAAALIAALPDQFHQRFTVEVEQGEVVGTILEVAARDHADLIVIGTHGRTGVSHLLLGSVAERIVRRAACPVLTVRLPGAAA
jgi:nucleotide-binding universal stress UspA family protein